MRRARAHLISGNNPPVYPWIRPHLICSTCPPPLRLAVDCAAHKLYLWTNPICENTCPVYGSLQMEVTIMNNRKVALSDVAVIVTRAYWCVCPNVT